jgi:hypothetical protein
MVMFFHFMPNRDLGPHPVMHIISKLAVFGQTGGYTIFCAVGLFDHADIVAVKVGAKLFPQFLY